jgi:AsmA protein
MKKLIKWVLRISAFLALLIMLLVLAMSVLFDPNDFKHHAADFVHKETGHRLEINGPVELQWFPAVGLQLSEVEFTANQDLEVLPLFTAASLRLELDLWSILGRHIKIDDLTLSQPVVNLWIDQKGEGNWESLLHNLSATEPLSNDDRTPESALTLAIHRMQLQDASVHWLDKQSGKGLELEHLNISTGYLLPGKPALIEAQLKLSTVQPAIKLDLSLIGELNADEHFKEIDINGLVIETTAYGENFPEAGTQLKLATDLSLNFPGESFQLSDLSIVGLHTHITGQLHGKGFSGWPQLNGQLVMQETNLRSWLVALGVAVETADSQVLTRLSADIGLQQQDELLLLHPIQIQLDDSMIHGKAQIRIGDDLQMNGQLTIDRIDLDSYLVNTEVREGTGFQLSTNVEALRKLQLDAELAIGQLTLNRIVLQQVKMQMQSSEGAILLTH